MATDVDMEDESLPNPSPSPSPSPSKRLAVKKTIQTNFGDEYVFQIASSSDQSTLAVSLSSNLIKIYSPTTGQYVGECRGHTGTINEISLSMPSFLWSCSSDGTARAWDCRAGYKQVSLFQSSDHASQEMFSFCTGGSSGNLLAAGCNSQILLWDLRNRKLLSSLEESHTDDVTQVHFVPNQQNMLVSSAVDGLICIYDIEGNIGDDDENLETVMNVGTSVGRIGFFGESNQKLWCLTHIETLSVWDWREGRTLVNFEEARTLASDSWLLDNVDYFVDCFYNGVDDRMWVIGGTYGGTLGYFPVSCDGSGSIGPAEAILEGGHSGVVRSVLSMSSAHGCGSNGLGKGIFAWSGGEDGRLCCWLSDEKSEAKHSSWISPALAMKSPRSTKKCRSRPY